MIILDRTLPRHYLDSSTGERYPSVSQVLQVLFPGQFQFVAPDVLEAARQRGRRLHQIFGLLLLYVEGVVAEPAIEPVDRPFANAAMNWIVKSDARPLKVEEPAINVKDGYGGTPDCSILYGPKRERVLVDLKTGQAELAHAVQVQAYHRLDGYQDAGRLLDLYIDDEGQVKESWVSYNPHEWTAFLNALGVLKWRLAQGL